MVGMSSTSIDSFVGASGSHETNEAFTVESTLILDIRG